MISEQSLFTMLWVAWLVSFAVIEGIALYRRRTSLTLSGHVWRVLRFRKLFYLLGAAFMIWLSAHFLSLGSFT